MTTDAGYQLIRGHAVGRMTSQDSEAFHRVEFGLAELAMGADGKQFQWYWKAIADDLDALNKVLKDADRSRTDTAAAVDAYAAGTGARNPLVKYLVDAAARRRKNDN